MLTAERHIFRDERQRPQDESHIDVSDGLVALEVDSKDLINLNDTIEPVPQLKLADKPKTCQQKVEE